MNKRFILLIVLAALGVILVSLGVKNLMSKRSMRIAAETEMKNKQSLLELADNYKAKRDYLKAKNALIEYMEESPNSENAPEIEKEIEKLNMDILFSNIVTDDSVSYEIKPGDTLIGIASKFNTTTDLIKKSNGIEGNLILPGKFLKVNNSAFKILVSKTANTLILKKANGEIIKTYTVSTGENFTTPVGTFKIEEKLESPVWYKVGAVVAPTSAEYELGARWMGLSASGYGIHGTNDETSIGKHITKGCVRMRNRDVEELYSIVPTGTEVVIVE